MAYILALFLCITLQQTNGGEGWADLSWRHHSPRFQGWVNADPHQFGLFSVKTYATGLNRTWFDTLNKRTLLPRI